MLLPLHLLNLLEGASASISGTITPSVSETDIRIGGHTLIITLDGDTWAAAGAPFDGARADILAGLDGSADWDSEVVGGTPVTAVVRTSDTVVTITFPAISTYDIAVNDTVDVTVPASALVGSSPIAAGAFTILAYTADLLSVGPDCDTFNRPGPELGDLWVDPLLAGYELPAIIDESKAGMRDIATRGLNVLKYGAALHARPRDKDHYVELTIVGWDPTDVDYPYTGIWPWLRASGSGATAAGYYGYIYEEPGVLEASIYRWDPGYSYTLLAVTSLLTPIQDGDVFRWDVRGSLIRGYRNGVEILSATDTTYPNQKLVGFGFDGSYRGSGFVDKFCAGNLEIPGSPGTTPQREAAMARKDKLRMEDDELLSVVVATVERIYEFTE